MSWYDYSFRPYVSVAQRRAKAQREVEKRKKKGHNVSPVVIEGRKIAKTFWGQSWCEHLESFSDYANRLPRGRTYVRNGSVVDLQIKPGRITALVSGSQLYEVAITIDALPDRLWQSVKSRCSGQIGSLVELLQGRLSRSVMDVVTQRDTGLFPQPREIKLSCSCPDWAGMCKHVAAVLYGVGARLDRQPDLLFLLRKVDHLELIDTAVSEASVGSSRRRGKRTIAGTDLSEVFGIEIAGAEPGTEEMAPPDEPPARVGNRKRRRSASGTTATTADPPTNQRAMRRRDAAATATSPSKRSRSRQRSAKRTSEGSRAAGKAAGSARPPRKKSK